MSDDIDNQTNQVHRLAAGEFSALWRGERICLAGGRKRLFNTRKAAWTFLARCDFAGRIIHNNAQQRYA
jgi:hypothetical protein